MAKVKKFGALAGVFTPSILTILGVIMYLRLGWVVGQAGLLLTLAIIIISHIISVSTGLSISSIATDKKIKTGGIYYILSRSLGMAMGGSIGIVLFIGTALSISLYIVGFTENFLSIAPIADFLGMNGSVNDIRIIGTVVILILITLALISTSLVIKTQYFILAAILLSLVSVSIGFFTFVHTETEGILWSPAPNSISFELLFAVFFPAVTGFTAGVAMSGDLKNPSKDIPRGTLASIIVGFLVYVSLAIGIAVFIDRSLLINDSNFLMTIAWFSPLVVMGIWGATLSSALGGILGGPRILQAIANDKIMPAFFGKGYGLNNEPRNALLLIFFISELGILLGDLNMIAGIVSMFYLASYGFINLAFALESFASTDFRPSFRISKWIGVIGFIASFAVMLKMDVMAMSLALIIMTGIYLFLKRKEFKSDSGDVWTSVWNTVARSALHKMDNNKIEDRNWQPNILLFSGSTQKRPHLVNFGKNLVGKFGVLSNFDLIEDKSSEQLFPKNEQSVSDEKEDIGIFYRRQSCRDIYQGIEIIASTYGFSGMEPNTVLMGWAKSAQPQKFAKLVKSLYDLDLNVLLMDYDKELGFGKKSSIDIWWRGEGLNNNLALFLAKFLMASPEWENAKLRLISISEFEHQGEQLFKKASYVLEALRIEAEITIINNQYNKRGVFDIIKEESIGTDLVYMGLPEIEKGKEQVFVDATNRLLAITGTVVLVKASSFFRKMIFIPDHLAKIPKIDISQNTAVSEEDFDTICTGYKLMPETTKELKKLYFELKNISDFFSVNYIVPATLAFTDIQKEGMQKMKNLLETDETAEQNKELFQLLEQINHFADTTIDALFDIAGTGKELQERAITQYQAGIVNIITKARKNFEQQYASNDIKSLTASTGSGRSAIRKLEVQNKIRGKAKLKIRHKKILSNQLEFLSNINLYGYFAAWFSLYFDSLVVMKELFRWFRFSLPALSETEEHEKQAFVLSNEQQAHLKTKMLDLIKVNNSLAAFPKNHVRDISLKVVNDLALLYAKPDVNLISMMGNKQKHELNSIRDRVTLLSGFWSKGYVYFLNELKLDNALTKVSVHLHATAGQLIKDTRQLIEINLFDNIVLLSANLDTAIKFVDKHGKNDKLEVTDLKLADTESIRMLMNEILEQSVSELKKLGGFVPEKVEITENFSLSGLFSKEQMVNTKRILSGRLVEELVANDVIAEIYGMFDLLTKEIISLSNDLLNLNRLITYSVDKESGMQLVDTDEIADLGVFLKSKRLDIEELKKQSDELNFLVQSRLEKSYNKLNSKLQLFNFKKEADNWNQFLPKSQTIKSISKITKVYNNFKAYADKQLENFWHKQSDALLLAASLNSEKEEFVAPLNSLLKLTAVLSPKPEIRQKLPFYYRQLFLNKEFYNTDFWFGRENELERAKYAWKSFQSGVSGALLVLGERNSGKSFFIHKFISGLAKEQNVVFVKPPIEGQLHIKSFSAALRKATGLSGDIDKIFKNLEKGSILVFDDLELCWQKSKNGALLIHKIRQLITEFGNKVFFVLSQNEHSFKIMNKIVPLSEYMLDIVHLEDFNSSLIEKTILFRHNSSGIKFSIDKSAKSLSGKDQDSFNSKHYARIFYKYFIISKGNIGMALSYWVSNIIDYTDENMTVRLPENINNSALDLLTTDQMVLLSQLVWHKTLSIAQFKEILSDKNEVFNNDLNFLTRCGLIRQNKSGLYELNNYVYPLLIEKLGKAGFILS